MARSILTGLLATWLVLTPSLSFAQAQSQAEAVGVILDAEGAHIRSAPTSTGASLYPADILQTESSGHAQVRIGQTRFQMAGDTSGVFFPSPSGTGALGELKHGNLLISEPSPDENFELYVSDVRIISGKPRPLLAQILYDSPCEVRIMVQRGELEVTSGKETKTIQEGKTYRIRPEVTVSDIKEVALSPYDPNYHKEHTHTSCAAAPEQHDRMGAPALAAGASHFIVGAAIVPGGLAAIAIIKALESPDRP